MKQQITFSRSPVQFQCHTAQNSVKQAKLWILCILKRTHKIMTWNLACWCILIIFTTDRIWSWSVEFSHFGGVWLGETGQIWVFRALSEECMGVLAKHLASWCILATLEFGYGFLIFLILTEFWLSDSGEVLGFWTFSVECMEGGTWNMACWYNLIIFRSY